jgi:16S rRNA (guanine966-N2)-methyltransferase
MTRIIAGFAGSLTLATPGSGTRPTSDRVREAIFSALESRHAVARTRVLDLYAGSGALGLEAASRGAAHVTLVDRLAAAATVCRKNAAVVLGRAPKGSELRVVVSSQAAQAFLDSALDEWDLVFLDPPYELDEAELAQTLGSLSRRLAADAVVMIERSSRSPQPGWPSGIELDRRKDYGDTTLWWARAV